MALCVNEAGTWRNITTQCVNESGTWRKVVDGCVNESSTWRCFGMTAPTVTLSVSPTSVARSGGEGETATLTWSSTKATSVVTSNFGAGAVSGSITVSPSSTTTYSLTLGNAFANTTATATLTVTAPTLGSSFGGGRLICRASSVNWIVAPNTSEVSRIWTSRNDANTRAQQVSGCTGWFVPTRPQLQNPGYTCRTFWDSFSSTYNWSSTESNATRACYVNFAIGAASTACKTIARCVRAFRCVTY